MAVAGAAATMQIAHVWPIVKIGQQSGWGVFAADTSLSLSLLLALGFAVQLPRRIPALLGARLATGRGADLGLSAAIVTLLIVLPAVVIDAPEARREAPILAAAGAIKPPVILASSPLLGSGPALASADRGLESAPPGSSQIFQPDLERGGVSPAGLDGEAKAVASDAANRYHGGALAADHGLDLARFLRAVRDDEARRRLAEAELVDALSGAAWQTQVNAERPVAGDRALGERD